MTEIRTERLLLRPMTEADRADVVGMRTHPDGNRYNHFPPTEADAQKGFDAWLTAWRTNGFGYLVATDATTGEYLGFGGLNLISDAGAQVLNLAYNVVPSVRGKGYAPEISRAVAAWAGRERPDIPLHAGAWAINEPSLRVARKAGFAEYERRIVDGHEDVALRVVRASLPELRTERLVLRPLTERDRAAAVDLQLDPAVNRFHPRPPDRAALERTFDRVLQRWDMHGFGYLAVLDPGSGELLGIGGPNLVEDDDELVVNLYYRFRASSWGQGFATELARTVIAWARTEVPNIPLQAVVRDINAPSIRTAEKAGLVEHRRRVRDGVHEILFRVPATGAAPSPSTT